MIQTKKKILDIIDELLGLKVNKNFRELVENTYKEESPIYHKEIRNIEIQTLIPSLL